MGDLRMTEENKLLPCPFCWEQEYQPYTESDDHYVMCGDCEMKYTVEIWNARA